MIVLLGTHVPARGETVKCVDAAGKTSYQTTPCPAPAAAETTQKFQAPSAAAGTSATTAAPSRPSSARVPNEADFKGPRETWERLGSAIRRGDKDAALKELTPAAQRRLAATIETIGSKSAPYNADELGAIRSVMLGREGLATITLTRTKADGTYLYQVNLIRDAEGKWRVDNM